MWTSPSPTPEFLEDIRAIGSYLQQFLVQLNVTLVVHPATDAGVPGPRGERFRDNGSIDGSIEL